MLIKHRPENDKPPVLKKQPRVGVGSWVGALMPAKELTFLVSGRVLACQQAILLVLAKTPHIHF